MTPSTESYEDTKTDTETFEHSSTKDIDWFRLTWVVMTSLLIFTIGMLGNVTTIYIYTRSKKLRRNKVFELILAVFDVFALTLPLCKLSNCKDLNVLLGSCRIVFIKINCLQADTVDFIKENCVVQDL